MGSNRCEFVRTEGLEKGLFPLKLLRFAELVSEFLRLGFVGLEHSGEGDLFECAAIGNVSLSFLYSNQRKMKRIR